MKKSKDVVVVMAIGEKYKQQYEKYFKRSHQRFATRHGLDLVIFDDFFDKSAFGLSRHVSWQKLLLFRIPELKDYNRICWIDADIYITHMAVNPFDLVPSGNWGCVPNNTYNLSSLKETDLELFVNCPIENRPSIVINFGFDILERDTHQKIMEYVYNKYPAQSCHEQGPMSYHLLKDFPGTLLPAEFNAQIGPYMMSKSHLLKLVRAYRYASENYFCHFCGGVNIRAVFFVKSVDALHRFIYNLFNFKDNLKQSTKNLVGSRQ